MLNAQILEEAAGWFVELDAVDATPAQCKAFDEWLRRSPEHVRAFLELLPLWEAGAAEGVMPNSNAEQLIGLARKAHSNIVALEPLRAPRAPPAAPERIARVVKRPFGVATRVFAAAAAFAIALSGLWLYSQRNLYTTDIGEQRSITLPDGSLVQLNARSQARIRITNTERAVELIRGQALFRVAREAARPFIVRSGETQIRAIGTEFDVYRKRTGTTVTVIEGRVAVSPRPVAPRPDRPVLLGAGEQTTIRAVRDPRSEGPSTLDIPSQARSVDVAAATAWTQRHLLFQKTSLAEVAEEFNRYNVRKLTIDDPKIQQFLVSGTFSSTDPASLLNFLRTQPGMRVTETGDEIRIEATP